MKKFIVLALSLIMAVTYGFSWTGQASAVSKNPKGVDRPINTSIKEYKEHEALVMFKSSKSVSSKKTQSILRSGEGAVSDIKVVDVWNFSEPESEVDESTQGSGKESALKASAGGFSNVALVRSNSLTTKEIIAKFKKRSDVLYAEPNYKIKALAVSDDTYSSYQWGMEESAGNVAYQWNEKGVTGSDSIVAVVDTGVDYNHEDLADNMWVNDHYPQLKGEHGFDFIKADDDPMDENGHGTHCAGIIGAVGNNGKGISGVNQKVQIMALRILDEDGSGYNAEEIAAYNYISKALDLGEPIKAVNNSWGGGEDSEIFAELMTLVGEKGAISVLAAGNESNNNDEYADYPANIDCDYSVTVGATRQDGQLVSFSNYGPSTVDVAAPGTDILSTVCYDCYNPSIYTESENSEISKLYNDYESASVSESENEWGIPDAEDVILPEGATYSADITDEGVNGSKALKISLNGMKTDSVAIISLPYTLDSTEVDASPHFSMMAKADTPTNTDWGYLVVGDAAADSEIGEDNFEDYEMDGFYLMKDQDYWDHFDYECLQDEYPEDESDTERKIFIALAADKSGDYSITVDDMGISKENLDQSKFKKYDFMSGTSMAAPFISGAVALKAQELGDVDTLTLLGETIAMTKDSPSLEINAGGSFDFSKKPAELGPRIATAKVGDEAGTIKITGTGLNPSSGLKVEISYSGRDEYKEANVIKSNDAGTEAVIEDSGWINNLIDLKVTGYNSKVAEKKYIYLVKGKKAYNDAGTAYGLEEYGKLTTDGRKLYCASSSTDSIMAASTSSLGEGFEEVATIDASKLFKEKSKTSMQDMLFSRDMASIGGKLYTVVEYGEAVEEPAEEDDFWFFFSKSGNAVKKMDEGSIDLGYADMYAATGVLYSSELRLVEINPSTGDYNILGKLPKDLESTMDWSMAAYNSKLYFMGGYSMAKDSKGLSTKVKVYDPSTKKWSDGKSLPEGRAMGHAIQTGKKLVYTLGYGEGQSGVSEEEQECPANLVFDGSKWTVANETLSPFNVSDLVKRGKNTYAVYDGNIGICKGGIVYIGTPVENYGDTFTYNVSTGKFKDTGYNYSASYDDEGIVGTTQGKNIYLIDNGSISKAPVDTGFIYIKYTKAKNGKVTGANRYYNPGDKAKITAKANKKYKIKSFKVGTKTVKVKSKTTKKTYTTPVLTKDLTVKVVFKKK